MYTHDITPGVAYHFDFTNHRGETAERIVIARSVQWGNTAWHPQLQWFLDAWDIEKQEVRSFPLANIAINTFNRYTDTELDALLTRRTVEAAEVAADKAVAEYKEELATQPPE